MAERFLLDENVPSSVIKLLKWKGFTVRTIVQAFGPGSTNGRIGCFGGPRFIPSEALAASMFVPGVISLAFYKRRPSRVQVILGLVATVALSALLGYISPPGVLGSQLGSVIAAVIGGVILYVAILAILLFWYQPRHVKPSMPKQPAPTP